MGILDAFCSAWDRSGRFFVAAGPPMQPFPRKAQEKRPLA
jgi:hypothetical protein